MDGPVSIVVQIAVTDEHGRLKPVGAVTITNITGKYKTDEPRSADQQDYEVRAVTDKGVVRTGASTTLNNTKMEGGLFSIVGQSLGRVGHVLSVREK